MILARAFGRVAFICPACAYINGSWAFNPRDPRVRCRNNHCSRSWRVGLKFTSNSNNDQPHNAVTCDLRILEVNRYAGNYNTDDSHRHQTAIASLYGSVEYNCPHCARWNWQKLAPDGSTICMNPDCAARWSVAVILWASTNATKHVFTPVDWSVSREGVDNPQRPSYPQVTGAEARRLKS